MFAAVGELAAQSLPQLATRKALIVINMQNDLFYVHDDFYVTKNPDFVPRLKEMIPLFRQIGDIVWVRTEAAALPTVPKGDATQIEAQSGQAAEDNRIQRMQEEEGLIDDTFTVSNTSIAAAQDQPWVPTVFPSSRSKDLMSRVSADTRAKKRVADSQVFDDGNLDHKWPEQLTKPRKGQKSQFCIAGTKGAELLDELKDLVDESRDLIVVKHYYSAFDQTSLLMSLRMSLTTEVYLCGCLTNTGVYTTAADAVQHGLQVTIVEDCLGYRNELRHDEAVRQMADVMGVNGTDSEEVIEEAGGRPGPTPETPSTSLRKLTISGDQKAKQAALVAEGQARSSSKIAKASLTARYNRS